MLIASNNNEISGNTANDNKDSGLYLLFSDYNDISGNTANYNRYGIRLYESNNNMVSGNTLMGNDECIVEDYCQGNTFRDNEYCDYGEGIPLELIILISSISGGAVIGVVTLLLIRRKRKRIQ